MVARRRGREPETSTCGSHRGHLGQLVRHMYVGPAEASSRTYAQVVQHRRDCDSNAVSVGFLVSRRKKYELVLWLPRLGSVCPPSSVGPVWNLGRTARGKSFEVPEPLRGQTSDKGSTIVVNVNLADRRCRILLAHLVDDHVVCIDLVGCCGHKCLFASLPSKKSKSTVEHPAWLCLTRPARGESRLPRARERRTGTCAFGPQLDGRAAHRFMSHD